MEGRSSTDGHALESKWDYKGCGIWESSEAGSDTRSVGSFQSQPKSPRFPAAGPTAITNEFLHQSISENLERSSRELLGHPSPNASEAGQKSKSASSGPLMARDSVSPPSAAASATQELDDLMSSLNDFKIETTTTEKNEVNTLDTMLGDLSEDLGKQGAVATQRGVCGECGKAIAGQVVTALGKTWHPEVKKEKLN